MEATRLSAWGNKTPRAIGGNPKTTPNLRALAGVGKMTEEDKKKIYEVVDGDWACENHNISRVRQ